MTPIITGGAIGPGDVYIERRADAQIFEVLRKGGLCHVISASRTGKTSLVLRALRRLKQEGFRVGHIDITGVVLATKDMPGGTERAVFFRELAKRVNSTLRLNLDAKEIESCTDPAGWQRLVRHLRELQVPIALALDETNSLVEIAAKYREGFLASFKSFDSDRALSGKSSVGLCLLGYASPQALMTRRWISPFNVSKAIYIDDFTVEELYRDLMPELEARGMDNAREVIDTIYGWTEGHPYMSAKLAELATSEARNAEETTAKFIDRLVGEAFLKIEQSREAVLDYAVKQIRGGDLKKELNRLDLYRRILEEKEVDPGSVEEGAELQLSGLVRSSGQPPRLKVRNRIMATRYDISWVEGLIDATQKARPFREAMEKWKAGGEKESELATVTKIEAEVEAGSSWDLSREEIRFLGRSVAQIARAPRRAQRIAIALSFVAVIVTAIAAVLVDYKVEEREAAVRDSRVAVAERDEAIRARDEMVAARDKANQDLNEINGRRREIEELAKRCRENDADARAKMDEIALKLQRKQHAALIESINEAANFLANVYDRDHVLVTKLRGSAWYLAQQEEGFSVCSLQLQSCSTWRSRLESERDQCLGSLYRSDGENRACRGDLHACRVDLATRTTERDSCQASLSTCNGFLSTCQGSLRTCSNSLQTCQQALGTCPSNLQNCLASLGTCPADLATQRTACANICAATPQPAGCPCPP